MGLLEQFPYTNFHEMNLDWMLKNQKQLGGKMESLTNEMESLTNEMDSINDNINDNVKTQVNAIMNKWLSDGTIEELVPRKLSAKSLNVVLIGDSYGAYSDSANVSYTNRIINAKIFNTCKQYSVAGAGFGEYNSRTNFINILNNISDIADPESIDIVFVGGGYNDRMLDRSVILDGINTFCTACRKKFPNAKIMIAHVGRCTDASQFANLIKSIQAYQSCSAYGAEYIVGSEYIMHDYYTLFNADGVHPNTAGNQQLFYYISQGILTGNCNPLNARTQMKLTLKTNIGGTINWFTSQNGNTVIFELLTNLHEVTYPFSITGNVSDWKDLGTITSGYLKGIPNQSYVTCTGYFQDNSNVWHPCTYAFHFNNGEVWMSIAYVGNNGYQSSTVKSMYIIGGRYAFLSDMC